MESIYAFVLAQLQEHKGRWPAVAQATGISLRTIEKIARQEVMDPRISNIEKLAHFFNSQSPARPPAH